MTPADRPAEVLMWIGIAAALWLCLFSGMHWPKAREGGNGCLDNPKGHCIYYVEIDDER